MEVASEGRHCVLQGEGGGAGGVCDQWRSRYDAGDGEGEPGMLPEILKEAAGRIKFCDRRPGGESSSNQCLL